MPQDDKIDLHDDPPPYLQAIYDRVWDSYSDKVRVIFDDIIKVAVESGATPEEGVNIAANFFVAAATCYSSEVIAPWLDDDFVAEASDKVFTFMFNTLNQPKASMN